RLLRYRSRVGQFSRAAGPHELRLGACPKSHPGRTGPAFKGPDNFSHRLARISAALTREGVAKMLSRRSFLKSSALAMFGVGSAPAWLSRALYARDASPVRRKVLVVIFQRGAVVGLNVVVPHAEKTYYALRPTIAIPRPDGSDASAIDLD